jgi:hypothetical protein
LTGRYSWPERPGHLYVARLTAARERIDECHPEYEGDTHQQLYSEEVLRCVEHGLEHTTTSFQPLTYATERYHSGHRVKLLPRQFPARPLGDPVQHQVKRRQKLTGRVLAIPPAARSLPSPESETGEIVVQ